MIKIIGVTGPSAAGKSTLCRCISDIPYIDADALYHSMLIPPSRLLSLLREAFGDSIFTEDGDLDRSALSSLVFSDAEKLALLNKTVLPAVLDEIRTRISALDKEGYPAVLVDAPTLIESGFHRECDLVVAVLSAKDTRTLRAIERDNISRAKASERMLAQKDDDFYKSFADLVIINNGDIGELARQAEILKRRILESEEKL